MTDTTPTPPAGWYQDPHGSDGLRWWDGARWTEHTAPGSQPPKPSGGSTRRGWILVAGLVVVAALVGALVVLVQKDGGDGDETVTAGDDETVTSDDDESSTSTGIDSTTTASPPGATTTIPSGGPVDIRVVTIAANPTDGLHDRFEFGPNDKGVSAVEIIKDPATGGLSMSVERPGASSVLVDPMEGGFVVNDPDVGEASVSLSGNLLTVSWTTLDGEEGSVTQELTADQAAALGPPPTGQFGRRPAGSAVTQLAQVPSGLGEAPTVPYSLANVARVTSSWEPADVNVRVLPDRAFCQAPPVPATTGIEVGSVSCSGSWAPPVTTLVFHTSVTAHLLSIEELNSEDAARLRAECETRLNQYGNVVSFAEFVFGVAGVVASIAPTTAIPARFVTGLGGVGFALDALGRLLSPTAVADPCAREVQVRLLDQQSADFVRSLSFDVPFVVTPLDATYEVADQSGPVFVQPFPGTGSGVVGGGVNFRLVQTVGSGDFQATLTWTGDSDMDLHVIDPSGAEISFSLPTSSSGGQLDRDEIPSCGEGGRHAENIFWPVGAAPSGTYQVFVVHFSSCDQQAHTATIDPLVRGVSQGAQTFTIGDGAQSDSITVVVP